MRIRLKKQNKDGIMRVETKSVIKEVLINEDFFNPINERVSLCFRGENSSGIIDFSAEEIEHLCETLKQKTHLIKKSKILHDYE